MENVCFFVEHSVRTSLACKTRAEIKTANQQFCNNQTEDKHKWNPHPQLLLTHSKDFYRKSLWSQAPSNVNNYNNFQDTYIAQECYIWARRNMSASTLTSQGGSTVRSTIDPIRNTNTDAQVSCSDILWISGLRRFDFILCWFSIMKKFMDGQMIWKHELKFRIYRS